MSPGDEAEISVWRNGAIVTATVSLGERPVPEGQANAERKQNRQEKDDSLIKAAGMRVRVLDNELRNRLRLDGDVEGLAVLWVRPGSPRRRSRIATPADRDSAWSMAKCRNACPSAGRSL